MDSAMDFGDDQFAMPQPAFPRKPIAQTQPVQPIQSPVQRPTPRPIQSTQVRAVEQMRDQLLKQQEQAPISEVENKEGDTPPDDWLAPKIYKGSTNF
jgi:hypothetical protein